MNFRDFIDDLDNPFASEREINNADIRTHPKNIHRKSKSPSMRKPASHAKPVRTCLKASSLRNCVYAQNVICTPLQKAY